MIVRQIALTAILPFMAVIDSCEAQSASQNVYVTESYDSFDAESGDTVIVVMDRYPDNDKVCRDMGGTFVITNRIHYCNDIDF